MKKRTIIIAIIGVIAVVLVTVALTYAYWVITRTQTESNLVSAGCIDIKIDAEANDISLLEQSAIYDAEGSKLTPYEFTVVNNCDAKTDYVINLEALGDSSTSLLATSVKVMLDTNLPKKLSEYATATTSINDAYASYSIAAGTLNAKDTDGSSVKHEIRVWIASDAPVTEASKTFRSKITVTAGQNVKAGETLADLIINHATENSYLYETTPTFSTNPASTEYGLYKSTTSTGDEYYFRGMTKNNYVKFGTYRIDAVLELHNYSTWKWVDLSVDTGTPMYWRIVKINSDGTIKLAYDGIQLVGNVVTHQATINHGTYNNDSTEAKYVGYVYDDNVSSAVKQTLESWYQTHILTQYDKFIADSAFCNDKSSSTTNANSYGAYDRLTGAAPSSVCPNEEDELTVANGKLRYSVGLLTMDEIMMAGASNSGGTRNSYLNSREYLWTMTPASFDGTTAKVYRQTNGGNLDATAIGADYLRGIRPVINIKADVMFTGTGSIDDPYELVYE